MRKSVRALVVVLTSIIGAITLSVTSAFTGALAFGAVALIVPGTGTPNANNVANYRENARDRYLQGTACGMGGCIGTNLVGINYPASFFPLVIIPNWCRPGPDGCDTWNQSVGKGADALQSDLDYYLNNTNEKIVIFGYSQGGAVVANVMQNFGSLTQAQKDRIQVVTIGSIQNPDGGLFQRLAFLNYIPILDISFNPPMVPDTGVNYTNIGFQYDPVVYAPRYFGNPFSVLNALAAFETVHGYYLSPNGNGPNDTLPYGYTPATLAQQLDCSANPGNCRTDSFGNTYIMIPATSLPLADFILSTVPAPLSTIVKPLVDLFAPTFKVLADLGYDFSGDPSVPTPLSILPFNPLTLNPVQLTVQLIAAAIQGVQNAFGDLGSVASLIPVPTAPVPTQMPAPVVGPALAPLTTSVAQSFDSNAKGSMPSVVSGEAPAIESSKTVAAQAKTVPSPVPAAPAEQMTEPSTLTVAGPTPLEVEKPKKNLVPSMGRSDQLGISTLTPASHDEQSGPSTGTNVTTGPSTATGSTPPPVALAQVGSGVTGLTTGVTPTANTSGAAANHAPGAGTENNAGSDASKAAA